jgi:CAAX protease family protein
VSSQIVPRLRYGVLGTGLIVGLLWGVWHFITTFWSSGTSSGAISMAILLPGVLFIVGVLPAFRVLMVWVYDLTESLLVAMLMHAGLSAFTVILAVPPTIALVPGLTYDLVLAAALWAFVGAVAVINHGHLSRHPPLRGRVA